MKKMYELMADLVAEAYGAKLPEIGVVLNGAPYASGEYEFIKALELDEKEVIKYETYEGFVVAYLK